MFLVSNAYVSTSSGRVRQGNSACVMSESSWRRRRSIPVVYSSGSMTIVVLHSCSVFYYYHSMMND